MNSKVCLFIYAYLSEKREALKSGVNEVFLPKLNIRKASS